MSTLVGAAVTARPSPPPGGRGRRGGLLPQLALVTLCGGYAAGAAFGWGSSRLALIMGDFGLSAAAFAAAVSCLHYALARRGRFRPAWVMFGVSSAMAGAGNAIWGWYEVVLGQSVPSPSPADFCFLLFAPPAVVGLLILARRPVSRAGWVCLVLDTWLIGGSLLTISWSVALAHTTQRTGESVPEVALTLAYPLLDIALVSIVLVLHFRRSAAHRSAINTAIGALALTVLCDALFTSPLLHESYHSGQLLDAGWFAGSLLLAYAPWVNRPRGRRAAHRQERPADRADAYSTAAPALAPALTAPAGSPAAVAAAAARARRPMAGQLSALAPYLAAGVCTLGILYNVLSGSSVDRVVLFTACTVILALVVRQAIMLLDNISLTQELAQKENHFRSLVQGSSDVIMIAAPTGVLRYVSPAASGVYGVRAEEMVGAELASLIHPEDLGRVLHEVRRFLAAPPGEVRSTRIECRFRAGDGRGGDNGWLNVESTVNRHHGGLIFNSRDVTERVRLQARLQHSASHDALTDLPNRTLFTQRVEQALGGRRAGDRGTGRAVEHAAAVLYVDLDGFKSVNDTVGHQAGDELLVLAGRRLREGVRSGDIAARLGGDEFAVLIHGHGAGHPSQPPDLQDPQGFPDRTHPMDREVRIYEIADRLRVRLSEPYPVSGREVRVTPSIGVAFAEPGITPVELMRNADLAMYRAKQAGKARVELYSPQMRAEPFAGGRRAAGAGPVREGPGQPRTPGPMRAALPGGEFFLFHQPVVELHTGRPASVVAHARWRSAQGVVHTPAEFLRLADRGGESELRAAELGGWTLEEAVRLAAERHREGLAVPVTVRIPALRLTDHGLPPQAIASILTRHALPAGVLTVEVCDHDPRVGLDELEHRIVALRRLGVRISLDGFGDGHAAIGALRRLPVDALKLDRGLIESIDESGRLRKITAGLLRIARDLGLDAVADGVDRAEQIPVLRELGCRYGQGLAFTGPLEEPQLRRALRGGGFAVPAGLPEGGASAIALT
ncbi:putative bifunctional diguanylate cyclase/phosphodiesterase [Streptomyces polyrhachis]|uniref:Bifunctional diguanylate cyclase/phosphodiesterase n=1 Tax=Streptomyces polyrhachis TaxID=1282885 RepID=A0ABW2GJQ2_9ACTN